MVLSIHFAVFSLFSFDVPREYKFGESLATVQVEDRTYYYTQDWKGKLVDSSRFYIRTGHHNPTKFPVESRIQIADHINIGYYELGSFNTK